MEPVLGGGERLGEGCCVYARIHVASRGSENRSAWSAWYRGTIGPVEADLKDRPVLTVSECLYRRRL